MIFGGFPKAYSHLTYAELEDLFNEKFKEKCPDVNFKEEAKKISVLPPKKKAEKK